jgi:hypothetical protein
MIPFDVNAEKGALGCCVLGAYSEAVAAGVDDTWFNELKYKALWLLLGQLSDKGDFTETEVVMATQKLEELTPADILEASDAAPTAANFSYWLKPLREQKRRREYYNLASDVQQRVAREELDPFVDEVETRRIVCAGAGHDAGGAQRPRHHGTAYRLRRDGQGALRLTRRTTNHDSCKDFGRQNHAGNELGRVPCDGRGSAGRFL